MQGLTRSWHCLLHTMPRSDARGETCSLLATYSPGLAFVSPLQTTCIPKKALLCSGHDSGDLLGSIETLGHSAGRRSTEATLFDQVPCPELQVKAGNLLAATDVSAVVTSTCGLSAGAYYCSVPASALNGVAGLTLPATVRADFTCICGAGNAPQKATDGSCTPCAAGVRSC